MKPIICKSVFALLLTLTLVSFSQTSYADPATVTNNGNTRVRVQYFETSTGEYADMHLDPGETQTLPGGVEKVKIVREIGEWATPLPPDVTLDVEVKEGDQTVGLV